MLWEEGLGKKDYFLREKSDPQTEADTPTERERETFHPRAVIVGKREEGSLCPGPFCPIKKKGKGELPNFLFHRFSR